MRIAYLDAFSGLSGDMIVGALLHLGVSLDALRTELAKLPLTGYRLAQKERTLSGIRATKFQVDVYAPWQERSFHTVTQLLQESCLLPEVKRTALRMFTVLAEAESRVHGIPVEAVHFHEVGAVDSIVDIIGAAFGLHVLNITTVHVSPLPLGKGLVPSRHGVLPVPGPATVELLKGFQVCLEDGEAEMVTPTGAAIVAAVARQGPVPPLYLTAVGYGAGERILSDRPNLLRILLGHTSIPSQEESQAPGAAPRECPPPGQQQYDDTTHTHHHPHKEDD